MAENVSEEKRGWWYFTFCDDMENRGKYVKIYGTFTEARIKMFDNYGSHWGFQYSEEQWKEWEKNRPDFIEPEKELRVIE